MKKKPPLRLEWIEAGTLAENPANWRTHPQGQVNALKSVIGDSEIGWAGACLYNERTKRLIDGHARRNAVDPKTPIPVLIGSWSEDAEKKILLSLDPLGALAIPDTDQLGKLLDCVEFPAAMDELLADVKSIMPVEFSDPPDEVAKNADELRDIAKAAKAAANSGTATKNDTEKYLVVVFRTRAQRESLLADLGLPKDERYVQADSLTIAARRKLRPIKSDRESKAADSKHSGAGG